MTINKNILFFSYFLIFFFLLFEILFSKKNIFVFVENLNTIRKNNLLVTTKENEFNSLNNFLIDFKVSKKFREIVIKYKLFYKNNDEKILRYKIISE
jgi:hypothetical protein